MYRYQVWLLTSVFLALILVNGFSQEEKIDRRRWSIYYWQKMAEKGLVEVARATRVPPAVYTGSEIDALTVLDDNSPDVPIINSTDVTQSENSVFVNPLDKSIAFNSNNSTNADTVLYGTSGFFTNDGGSTWSGSEFGTGGWNKGDPATAINLNGMYFINFITLTWGQGIARSTDQGYTWLPFTVSTSSGTDKNHMWVDNSPGSPYTGNLYVAYTDFDAPGLNIYICRSTDNGSTWSSPQNISSAIGGFSYNQGVNIQTGPNGEVYVTWSVYDNALSDENAIGFTVSTDGGTTWAQATRIISNIRGIRYTRTSKNHRVNSFPVMAVDISGGPRNGWIYIVWPNIGVPGINQGPDIDVYMIRSADGGATWSSPVRVNQDPSGQGKEHYFSWITCDLETGVLSVIFYDDRNVSASQCETFVANSFDGGNSWEDFKVSDVAFTPSPIPGMADDYFGDYLGISARGGKVYPVWTDNRSGNALAYVSPFEIPVVEVTVDQKLSGNTSVDSVGRWTGGTDFIPYEVPFNIPFAVGEIEVLRGAQKIISNEKYQKWSLDDIVNNHREFTITSDFPTQLISKFNPTKPGINIRNEFLSVPGTNPENDSIAFKDPWLIDYPDPLYGNHLRNRGMDDSGPDALRFWIRSSPFNPDYNTPFGPEQYKYRGVFLDQPYTGNNPHYIVRAQQTHTISFHNRPITWYFQRWEGNDVDFENAGASETAVIFQDTDAEARAMYKGHLASGTTNALTFNNQRKMVFDGQKYHLVYEDDGKIYYTYSDDDGTTWSEEMLISHWNGDNKSPCIAMDDNGNILVVWQESTSLLARFKNSNGWGAIDIFYSMFSSTSGDATPVVDYIGEPPPERSYFHIVWRDLNYYSEYIVLKVLPYDPSTGPAELPVTIPGSNKYSKFPSIVSDHQYELHLVWEENSNIYYSMFDYSGASGYDFTIDKECISSETGYNQHVLPSITTDGGKIPNVIWQAQHIALGTNIIVHGKRPGAYPNEWAISSFINEKGDYLKPTITGNFNISGNFNLEGAWTTDYNLLQLAHYDGESWSDFWSGYSGYEPNLSSNVSGEENWRVAFRQEESVPYLIETYTQTEPQRSVGLSSTHHRRGVLSIGKAEIAYELGEFTVDGNNIGLYRYPDTISVGHNGSWEEVFRTEPFTVSGQTSLSFLQAFEILNRDSLMNTFPNKAKIEFRLEVVDAQSGQVLASPNVHVVTRNLPPDFRQVKNLVFNIPGSWNVYLRVGLQLPASLELGQSMVEAYYIEDSGSKQGSLAKNAEQEELTPTQYQLFQNSPNPFNPQTQIRFALPRDVNVRLTIYDVSGRQVRVLVNEPMAAGYHTAVWDGRNDNGVQVGTGFYFYHITAGDPSSGSGQRFSQVRKMLLVR